MRGNLAGEQSRGILCDNGGVQHITFREEAVKVRELVHPVPKGPVQGWHLVLLVVTWSHQELGLRQVYTPSHAGVPRPQLGHGSAARLDGADQGSIFRRQADHISEWHDCVGKGGCSPSHEDSLDTRVKVLHRPRYGRRIRTCDAPNRRKLLRGQPATGKPDLCIGKEGSCTCCGCRYVSRG